MTLNHSQNLLIHLSEDILRVSDVHGASALNDVIRGSIKRIYCYLCKYSWRYRNKGNGVFRKDLEIFSFPLLSCVMKFILKMHK